MHVAVCRQKQWFYEFNRYNNNTVCPAVYGESQAIHYSMLIIGTPTNDTFEWINPYKYQNPIITSMTILFTLTIQIENKSFNR